MPEVSEDVKKEIIDLVYNYFSEECDILREEINDNTDVINDLEGDSLMLLSLVEMVRKKYGINIELKTLGKHLMKKPASTVGEIVNLTIAIVKHGDNIINVEL